VKHRPLLPLLQLLQQGNPSASHTHPSPSDTSPSGTRPTAPNISARDRDRGDLTRPTPSKKQQTQRSGYERDRRHTKRHTKQQTHRSAYARDRGDRDRGGLTRPTPSTASNIYAHTSFCLCLCLFTTGFSLSLSFSSLSRALSLSRARALFHKHTKDTKTAIEEMSLGAT
jgi:hypothetical protein